jgi:Ca-activated chloride channel family protein
LSPQAWVWFFSTVNLVYSYLMSRHNGGRIFLSARWIWVCASVVAFGGDTPVNIQPRLKGPAAVEPRTDIRVDTSLVVIPLSVTDALNRPVTGLRKSNFRIFEGGEEQQVLHVTREDAPLAVGVVFDTSGSMARKMTKSRAAVAEFFQTANPQDEFFLVEFNSTAQMTRPFTSDPGEVQAQLASVKPGGQTALLDAVAMAMRELKKSKKPRKALVIFSDGGDNRSRFTRAEVKNMVAESDVLIYAMGIFEGGIGRLSAEEVAGPGLLKELADRTGGKMFPVESLKDLPDIAGRIGAELHSRYIIEFAPANLQRDGRYHKVLVKVAQPEGSSLLRVDSRGGYRAPGR